MERNAWNFFFTKLKEAIGDRDDLAIILDRSEEIQSAIKKMYPNAHHGFYMQILMCNMKEKFKSTSTVVHWKSVKAVETYTIEE